MKDKTDEALEQVEMEAALCIFLPECLIQGYLYFTIVLISGINLVLDVEDILPLMPGE